MSSREEPCSCLDAQGDAAPRCERCEGDGILFFCTNCGTQTDGEFGIEDCCYWCKAD